MSTLPFIVYVPVRRGDNSYLNTSLPLLDIDTVGYTIGYWCTPISRELSTSRTELLFSYKLN